MQKNNYLLKISDTIIIYYRPFLKSVVIVMISIALFAFTCHILARSRLSTIKDTSYFDISAILNISKDRITDESETYNKKEFIQYDCIIDSIYYITVVKAGKIANIKLFDSIHFESKPFPNRTGLFGIASPSPFTSTAWFHHADYNVFLLPLNEVDKINVFVRDKITNRESYYSNGSGKIINKEYLNYNTISYFVESSLVDFSFNGMNKDNLRFFYAKTKEPIFLNVFFTIDKDNNLYIGCASTDSDAPKTLKEI